MTTTHFILASSSPRRRELLTHLGVTFTVIKPDIDERHHPGERPLAYVRRLSIEKAQAVAQLLRASTTVDDGPASAWILAADTVVILAADTIGITDDGAILGKPADADEARDMLRRLRHRPHIVCTAVTLLEQLSEAAAQPRQLTELTQTTVHMRDYRDDEIEAYIATGDPFDKAGGYAIQHEGFSPVARIEGSRTNVVGLPVETVQTMLRQFSILP